MLIIVRGIAGSGKTTFVKKTFPEAAHYEADMYFEQGGEYKFDASKLKEAHNWCRKRVYECIRNKKLVVVSNTFTQFWEVSPYIDYALLYNEAIILIELTTFYGSVHSVPQEVIDKQKARFISNIDIIKSSSEFTCAFNNGYLKTITIADNDCLN